MKKSLEGSGGRVCCLILVDKPGFRGVQSSVFRDLGLGLARFWLNRFEVQAFWRGSSGFEVQFWWTNLGLSEFKVQPVKFEAVRSSLYLGSIQHYFEYLLELEVVLVHGF